MDINDLLLFAHVIGATVLLGTGAGIAFFMVMANRTKDPALIAHTGAMVVLADLLFTATAVVIQPITGVALALNVGWSLREGWIAVSILLYIISGVFWLPVVWIQMQMRDIARKAAMEGTELPARYHRLYAIWFVCGFPAFAAVLAVIWLMLTKPDLGLF